MTWWYVFDEWVEGIPAYDRTFPEEYYAKEYVEKLLKKDPNCGAFYSKDVPEKFWY